MEEDQSLSHISLLDNHPKRGASYLGGSPGLFDPLLKLLFGGVQRLIKYISNSVFRIAPLDFNSNQISEGFATIIRRTDITRMASGPFPDFSSHSGASARSSRSPKDVIRIPPGPPQTEFVAEFPLEVLPLLTHVLAPDGLPSVEWTV